MHFPSLGQPSTSPTPQAGLIISVLPRALGPESIRQSSLLHLYYRSSLVDFAAVWTPQTAPPHPEDEPQCDIAHQKSHDAEDGSVRVDDEDEVVNVDHSLGVPRAGTKVLWRSMWIEV